MRFFCLGCRHEFSSRTFSTRYYLKRPELLEKIAALLNEGCSHRQIGRVLGCAPSTVTRQARRLGDHARRFHCEALERIETIEEPVVLDHFETFVRSQVERLAIATPTGQRSWFVYETVAGRYLRTRPRAARRGALKRAPRSTSRRPVARSTENVLQTLLSRAGPGLRLVSDDHPAYAPAVARLGAGRIDHQVHPNPVRGPGSDSVLARRRDAAMFAVDLTHKLMRHGLANHKRETLSVARSESAVVGRAYLFAVWRNFIKGVSENRPRSPTPAMRVGLAERRWTWRQVLGWRLFDNVRSR